MLRAFYALAVLVGLVQAPPAQVPLAGVWNGSVLLVPTALPMSVTFKDAAGAPTASIDIQGVKGLPLRGVSHTGDKVHFELPAGPGLAVFEGFIAGDRITGTFTQGQASGMFTLTRDAAASAAALAPVPPPPYRSEEVTVTNGAVTLAGTLTIPPGAGPFPAVALITGSGPQNRDEEILGFRPFQVIADHLSRHGVAVLRCDDRGVGGSTGSLAQVTTADIAMDGLAAAAFLMKRSEVDAKRVHLLGHSEGAQAAIIAASKSSSIASIILMAGPAVRGDVAMRRQNEDLMRLSGADEALLAKGGTAYKRMTDAVLSDAPAGELTDAVRALALVQLEAQPAVRAQIGDPSAFIDQRLAPVVAQMRSPWMRYALAFDPGPYLSELSCPVLGLFGAKDSQVSAELNRPALENAAAKGRGTVTVKTYPDANHLFIKAVTGSPAEYPMLEKVFVPGFLDDLTAWLTR